MRMTRKILDAKAETFNDMFEKRPGLTVVKGFECYNIIVLDPDRKQVSSVLTKYGLTIHEAANYLDGLLHAAQYCRDNNSLIPR